MRKPRTTGGSHGLHTFPANVLRTEFGNSPSIKKLYSMADFLQRKEFMQSVPFFHLLAGHTVTHCEHMTKTHRQGKAVLPSQSGSSPSARPKMRRLWWVICSLSFALFFHGHLRLHLLKTSFLTFSSSASWDLLGGLRAGEQEDP